MDKEVSIIKTILNGIDETHIIDKYIKMLYDNFGPDRYQYLIDTYALNKPRVEVKKIDNTNNENKFESSGIDLTVETNDNEIDEFHKKLLSGVITQVGKTVKVKRSAFLINLSDIIKTYEMARVYESNVIDEELKDESDDDNEKKERFHDDLTQKLLNDVINDGRLFEAKQDEEFARRNFYLSVFQDTENICKSLTENKNNASLKKVHIINTDNLSLIKGSVCETLPVGSNKNVIKCIFDNVSYNTVVSVVNKDPLEEICEINDYNAVYCMAGNQLVPGGNSDQGIYSHETDVYLSTTYSCSIDQSYEYYPLSDNTVILSPFVIVIKDYKKQFERSRSLKNIQIITYGPKYRPSTNIDKQSHTEFDNRLANESCRYTNPADVEKQYTNVFKVAMFFNYDTVVLDDRGIETFWLPIHHTAQILSNVIKTHMNRFKRIIVAVKNPYVYEIFRMII